MPTVLSKPVRAEGSLSPEHWVPVITHQTTPKRQKCLSETNDDSCGDDEPLLTEAQLEMLRTQAHLHRLQGYLQTIRSIRRTQQLASEASISGARNPDDHNTIQEEQQIFRKDGLLAEHLMESQPNAILPPSITPNTDIEQHLQVLNGQMRLEIFDWQTANPDFIMRNNPRGNPKTGLDVVIGGSDSASVEFKMSVDFPGGMSGFMGVIQALFTSPRMIGITKMETGSAVVNQESRNPKKSQYHIKWTTPWETDGCRVSWMKEKENSTVVKFKFVNIVNASPEEQVLASIDECDGYYQHVSQKDPNIYGKWMSMPVRIWLHTQWVLFKEGSDNNNLFNKLPVMNDNPNPPKRNKKDKSRKPRKKSSKFSKSEAPEGLEMPGSQKASEENETPGDCNKKDTEEGSSAVVGSPEHSESERKDMMVPISDRKDHIRNFPNLKIDTVKSNMQWKHKRGAGSDGAIQIKHAHQSTHRRGNSFRGLNTNTTNLLTEFVPVPGQNHTADTSLSPTLSGSSTTPSTAFKTARSQITPLSSLPSPALSHFFTPMTSWEGMSEAEIEGQTDMSESESSGQQCSHSQEPYEVELRRPVLKTQDEPCFSDPEEYITVSKALKAARPCKDSPDAIRLGLFEGLQKNTVSSPTANPPLTQRTSYDEATTDSNSTELVTKQSTSDATAQQSSQAQVDKKSGARKTAHKRKKFTKRKHRACQQREEAREASSEARDKPLAPIPEEQSPTTSSSHGVEGHTPSAPETFNDEELTPKAMQFGDIGTPSSQTPLDLTTLAVACAKPGCGAVCGFKDGVSVICPKCGPYSMTRYCGKNHLWEDVKAHWAVCSTHLIKQPCLTSSISADALVGPPMLPCFHQWDTPARHRQAVWFSSASDLGDYFVFADWTEPMEPRDAPASHMRLRCSPQVAFTVRFEDAQEKDRFRRCLAISLFAAVEHPALVDYLYRLVRDWMRAHIPWASDNDVDSMLCDQMSREMGSNICLERVGLRHACETEWLGANLRHCEDPTCTNERPLVLLGSQCMGLGFRRMCEYLESKHWILRAHRAIHPSVSDVVARTGGGGYSEVLTEDRRRFRRGEGWDGVGTGPMELERP